MASMTDADATTAMMAIIIMLDSSSLPEEDDFLGLEESSWDVEGGKSPGLTVSENKTCRIKLDNRGTGKNL